jgi:hypothetical protein
LAAAPGLASGKSRRWRRRVRKTGSRRPAAHSRQLFWRLGV